jgi:hypothetical protein
MHGRTYAGKSLHFYVEYMLCCVPLYSYLMPYMLVIVTIASICLGTCVIGSGSAKEEDPWGIGCVGPQICYTMLATILSLYTLASLCISTMQYC